MESGIVPSVLFIIHLFFWSCLGRVETWSRTTHTDLPPLESTTAQAATHFGIAQVGRKGHKLSFYMCKFKLKSGVFPIVMVDFPNGSVWKVLTFPKQVGLGLGASEKWEQSWDNWKRSGGRAIGNSVCHLGARERCWHIVSIGQSAWQNRWHVQRLCVCNTHCVYAFVFIGWFKKLRNYRFFWLFAK